MSELNPYDLAGMRKAAKERSARKVAKRSEVVSAPEPKPIENNSCYCANCCESVDGGARPDPYPECCLGYGLQDREIRDGKWWHHWTVPNGDEGYEACSFNGRNEELVGFHAVSGFHFRRWSDGVHIHRYIRPYSDGWPYFCHEAVIPGPIWETLIKQVSGATDGGARERDECQVCEGFSGGVRGNENIVKGVTVCDYCSSKISRFERMAMERKAGR
jgi:hypothetical protein